MVGGPGQCLNLPGTRSRHPPPATVPAANNRTPRPRLRLPRALPSFSPQDGGGGGGLTRHRRPEGNFPPVVPPLPPATGHRPPTTSLRPVRGAFVRRGQAPRNRRRPPAPRPRKRDAAPTAFTALLVSTLLTLAIALALLALRRPRP